MGFNLIFDVALRENCVYRRGTGKQGKGRKSPGSPNRASGNPKERDMGRNVERYMKRRSLGNYMCRSTEGAIRVVRAV